MTNFVDSVNLLGYQRLSKIFINNFPNPLKSFQLEKIGEEKGIFQTNEINILVGFDILKSESEHRRKIATDIISSVLTHDKVVIRTKRIINIIGTFGFADTMKLFDCGCFELIDDIGLEFPIAAGKRFGITKLIDSGDNVPLNDSLRWIEEKFYKLNKNADKKSIDLILLDIQKNNIVFDSDSLESISSGVLNEINYDLGNSNLTQPLEITSKNYDEIDELDLYKVLRLVHINAGLVYSSKLNTDGILIDGGIENILPLKVSPALNNLNLNTSQLIKDVTNSKGIPDLGKLYIDKIISIEDIIKIRENFNGKKFRDWLESVKFDQNEVTRELLNNRLGINFRASQKIRFLVTNTIGLINPIAGIAASAVDSIVVDKILKSWHPRIFLDNVLKREIDDSITKHQREKQKALILEKFPNISRNDPCPCSSGKKWKNCHGKY